MVAIGVAGGTGIFAELSRYKNGHGAEAVKMTVYVTVGGLHDLVVLTHDATPNSRLSLINVEVAHRTCH